MSQLLKLVVFALLLTACVPHHPTVAEQRAQKRAQDSADCVAQEKSIVYLDSLLQTTLPQVDEVLPSFTYEKNPSYENRGHYVHRLLTTSRNTNRTFLQVHILDNGELTVRSYYVGSRALSHTAIRLAVDSGFVVFKGTVHTFDAEGQHEILTIEGDDAWQLLRFVDSFSDSRIQVVLSGKGNYIYYLSNKDKQALVESYRLAIYMRDIKQLERQHQQAVQQVQKYKKKL